MVSNCAPTTLDGEGVGHDHGVLVVELEHLRGDVHTEGVALTAITVYHDTHENPSWVRIGSSYGLKRAHQSSLTHRLAGIPIPRGLGRSQ